MENSDINQWIVRLIDSEGKDFLEVYPTVQAKFPDLARHSIRARYYRNSTQYKQKTKSLPVIRGVSAGEKISAEEALKRAIAEYNRTLEVEKRKRNQSILFEAGPVCLVFMADVHAGGAGVNYNKLMAEAKTIRETPGMYVVTVGDLVDQFVLGTLRNKQFNSRITIEEEWVIAHHVLEILAPKILVSVAGNHDNWSSYLIGVDYFKDILASVRKDVLYDSLDCRFTFQVAIAQWKIRVRHSWRGRSQWNITHGIEKAAKFDSDFDIGVGGHTHESGVIRMFNNSGKMGYAILCGSYKEYDDYADFLGVPTPNSGTSMPLVFKEDGTCVAFECVDSAADFLELYYDG